MATRDWYYAEKPAVVSTSTGTPVVHSSLTFTPKPNVAYAIMWGLSVASAAAMSNVDIDLWDGTSSLASVINILNLANVYVGHGGFYILAANASPTQKTFSVRFDSSNGSTSVSARQSHIVAIELTADDVYAESLGDSTINNVATEKVHADVTVPAGGGTYMILTTAEGGNVSGDTWIETSLELDQTSMADAYAVFKFGASGDTSVGVPQGEPRAGGGGYFYHFGVMYKTTWSAGAHKASMWAKVGSGTYVGHLRQARVLLLRLDGHFNEVEYAEKLVDDETAGTSLSYADVAALNSVTFDGGNYLVIGYGHVAFSDNSETYYTYGQITMDGTTVLEGGSSFNYGGLTRPVFAPMVVPLAAGTHSIALQQKVSSGTYTMFGVGSVIALKLPNRPARDVQYAEGLAEQSTTSSAAWTTQATLTFTPKANTDYILFWSGSLSVSSTTVDAQIDLYDVTNSVELEMQNMLLNIDTVATRYFGCGGMWKLAAAASPPSRTFTVRFNSESGSATTTKCRDARLVALELTADDVYSEDLTLTSHTGSGGWSAEKLRGNITVPTGGGSYLVCTSCVINGADTTDASIQVDSASYGAGQFARADGNPADTVSTYYMGDSTQDHAINHFLKKALTAGAHYTGLWVGNWNGGSQLAGMSRARILYLRLDDGRFGENFYAEDLSDDGTTGGSASYADIAAINSQTLAGGDYLVLGDATYGINDTTVHEFGQMILDGATVMSENEQWTTEVQAMSATLFSVAKKTLGAGSHSVAVQKKNASGTAGALGVGSVMFLQVSSQVPQTWASIYMGAGF
jgi:hypothetical protein